jgi:5-formyltetrahydrofolate cyclo-ligase
LKSLDELESGVYGTSHPINGVEYFGDYDLIIVPGLAFDDRNQRLGYGGGYYDDFMKQYPHAHKLGICYPFQKVKQVPVELHDLKIDDVLYPLEQ